MAESGPNNGATLAAWIAGAGVRPLPPDVADRARLCLADWLGVAIGAGDEAAGRIVREVAAGWRTEGAFASSSSLEVMQSIAGIAERGKLDLFFISDSVVMDPGDHPSANQPAGRSAGARGCRRQDPLRLR